MKRLLLVALVLACGKDQRPSLAGASWQFQQPDAASGVQYVGHLDKITQDDAGDVAGEFTLGAVGYTLTYQGKIAGVFVNGEPQLQLRIPGFNPWNVAASASADRMVGTANGSGFIGVPFIAGRGDVAWMTAMAKATRGAMYHDARRDPPADGEAGRTTSAQPLPDITSAFR